jgi:hypothetical protein
MKVSPARRLGGGVCPLAQACVQHRVGPALPG